MVIVERQYIGIEFGHVPNQPEQPGRNAGSQRQLLAAVDHSKDRPADIDVEGTVAQIVSLLVVTQLVTHRPAQAVDGCRWLSRSTQRRYSDKRTNRKPRRLSLGSAASIPSAVPLSGRFMCARMIEPGLLRSIASATWAAE